MRKIVNTFARLKRALLDYFTPDASGLIAMVAKFEQVVERSIDKETRALSSIYAARMALDAAAKAKNANVDKSLKLLHNISRLTA